MPTRRRVLTAIAGASVTPFAASETSAAAPEVSPQKSPSGPAADHALLWQIKQMEHFLSEMKRQFALSQSDDAVMKALGAFHLTCTNSALMCSAYCIGEEVKRLREEAKSHADATARQPLS